MNGGDEAHVKATRIKACESGEGLRGRWRSRRKGRLRKEGGNIFRGVSREEEEEGDEEKCGRLHTDTVCIANLAESSCLCCWLQMKAQGGCRVCSLSVGSTRVTGCLPGVTEEKEMKGEENKGGVVR